ncbi:hypothetical protein Lpp189_05118 [Lacticaseibacillus paracasei subsp. paracasei Lpp189]|nr:hypothetical protein Lpp189_05118 [Lacticaseibacillus paracasei subsp. paracasei Lpp189]
MSESRDFSEELLYRILTKLVEDGSLKLKEQA